MTEEEDKRSGGGAESDSSPIGILLGLVVPAILGLAVYLYFAR